MTNEQYIYIILICLSAFVIGYIIRYYIDYPCHWWKSLINKIKFIYQLYMNAYDTYKECENMKEINNIYKEEINAYKKVLEDEDNLNDLRNEIPKNLLCDWMFNDIKKMQKSEALKYIKAWANLSTKEAVLYYDFYINEENE